jgi:hypothetical protein
LWDAGTLAPGTDFHKYTESRSEDWCADFVSYVFNEAGDPFGPAGSYGKNWDVSYTANFLVPPQYSTKFVVHAAAGYTPQPGDVALHSTTANPWYHVNIVVGVSGSKITLIGGNQSAPDDTEPYYIHSKVSTYSITSSTGDDIVDYVSPIGE